MIFLFFLKLVCGQQTCNYTACFDPTGTEMESQINCGIVVSETTTDG